MNMTVLCKQIVFQNWPHNNFYWSIGGGIMTLFLKMNSRYIHIFF